MTSNPRPGLVPPPDAGQDRGWEGGRHDRPPGTPTRELESRSNDGIDVRLLWSGHDNRVLVSAADAKTGDGFAIEVREGERAMDVFHHPFAYAAWRDVATRVPPADSGSPARQLAA